MNFWNHDEIILEFGNVIDRPKAVGVVITEGADEVLVNLLPIWGELDIFSPVTTMLMLCITQP